MFGLVKHDIVLALPNFVSVHAACRARKALRERSAEQPAIRSDTEYTSQAGSWLARQHHHFNPRRGLCWKWGWKQYIRYVETWFESKATKHRSEVVLDDKNRPQALSKATKAFWPFISTARPTSPLQTLASGRSVCSALWSCRGWSVV